MKITQMKFQKIVVKLVVLFAAIATFYAVAIFASQFYQHNQVKTYSEYGDYMDITGYLMFESVQPFNKSLFTLCVVYLLVSLTLLVFFSQSRRNYYISNYITCGVTSAFGLGLSVYALINIFKYRAEYKGIDFDSINNNSFWLEDKMPSISDSTWSFDIGIIVFISIAILAVCLILNLVWKTKAMKEDRLKYAEIDKQIRAEWARKEQELLMEAEKYES